MSDFNCNCSPTYSNGVASPIPPFWGFSAFTPTIPKLYWNVKSQEQRILNLFDLLNKLVCYCDKMGLQIDVNAQDIADLQRAMQELKDGGLLDFYEKQIYQWIQDNMEALISRAIKFVYFGLTKDGYFCAYIPKSWSEITFDTGAVYGRSDYGRLELKMQTDSPNSIDNTYGYSLNAQPSSFKQLIADLEVNAKRTESTFDTLFTNLDSEVVAPWGDTQANQIITKDGENV
jgi:hypothetical protein